MFWPSTVGPVISAAACLTTLPLMPFEVSMVVVAMAEEEREKCTVWPLGFTTPLRNAPGSSPRARKHKPFLSPSAASHHQLS